jgi:hypothetical protein
MKKFLERYGKDAAELGMTCTCPDCRDKLADEIMEEHIRHVQDGRARNNPKKARSVNPKNN